MKKERERAKFKCINLIHNVKIYIYIYIFNIVCISMYINNNIEKLKLSFVSKSLE